jgi:hypothetical protein
MLKLKIGEEVLIKDLHTRFIDNNFMLSEVGMEVLEEDVEVSTDLDFYNYLTYKSKTHKITVDFDILVYSFENWLDWYVKINHISVKRIRR